MSASIFPLLGERADIVMCMRWTMLPIDVLFFVLLYRLGARLFSPRIGLWGTLIAATFPDLYFKLGEYRPDLFWAALWLLILNILTGGDLRPRRLFAAGVTCGFAFAVSMKTAFLLLIILVAGAVTWFLSRLLSGATIQGDGDNPGRQVVQGIFALIGGILIVPLLVVAFFASQGALGQFYSYVITYNLMPSDDLWSRLVARTRDTRFWLFIFTLSGGWWLVKQDKNREISLRRLFFFSVVGFFCTILFSFWPLVSKQDYIPFYPIVSLAIAVPLVMLAERFQRFLPAFALPALVAVGELASLVSGHPPLKKTNQENVQLIADALRLTHPGETVLDAKGQTIFRPRPYFYNFEQITRERVEQGKLSDDSPQHLVAARTPVVVRSHWLTSATADFISQNYISVGLLMVLGKRLPSTQDGKLQFEIVIPEKYAIVNEKGFLTGTLDGIAFDGSRDLGPGHHELVLNSPTDSVVVLWARAVERGFSPFRPVQN